MRQLTFKDIAKVERYYDGGKHFQEDWTGTVKDILNMNNIPSEDRLFIVLNAGGLSDEVLKRFALSCARSIEHLGKGTIVKDYNDMIESYLHGKISLKEIQKARINIHSLIDTVGVDTELENMKAMIAYEAACAFCHADLRKEKANAAEGAAGAAVKTMAAAIESANMAAMNVAAKAAAVVETTTKSTAHLCHMVGGTVSASTAREHARDVIQAAYDTNMTTAVLTDAIRAAARFANTTYAPAMNAARHATASASPDSISSVIRGTVTDIANMCAKISDVDSSHIQSKEAQCVLLLRVLESLDGEAEEK
jgi:hypothetical protein